jgi:hypothetical protein
MSSLPDKVVRITLDPTGLPIPDAESIKVKKDTQKVTWCADFEFSIDVEGYDDVKAGTGGSDCRFTWKSGRFTEVRTYKYSITANGRINDPDIDIEP